MYNSSDPWKCLLLGSADLLSIVDCGKIFKKHYCPFSINWGHITMLAEDRGSGGNMCLPMVLNVVFPMLMCWTSLLNQLSMHILVDLKEIILHVV